MIVIMKIKFFLFKFFCNFIIYVFFLILSNKFSYTYFHEIRPIDKKVGVILGGVVNVRNKPNLNGQIITTVKKNEYVKITKWQNKKERIAGFEDKWVKIKTKQGKSGFIFGAFLFDLKKLYNYKWSLSSGTGVFGWIIFNRNLTYTFFIDYAERTYPNSPNRNLPPPPRVNGKFKFIGNKIVLDYKLVYGKKLFLFKLKGINLLIYKKLTFNNSNPAVFWQPFKKR